MAAKHTLGIMGSWWRDRHRPNPSVAGSGEIPLPGMTSWLCAGRRYTLAPSPSVGTWRAIQGDEPAGAPVLQQGGPELKSTAAQAAVASGEVGQRRLPPVSGVCQRWAPIRASSSHTAEVGLTGAGSQYPVGVASGNLAGRPAGWVTAFRAAGGLALWAGLSRRGCGFGTWAAGPGVPPSKSRHRSG